MRLQVQSLLVLNALRHSVEVSMMHVVRLGQHCQAVQRSAPLNRRGHFRSRHHLFRQRLRKMFQVQELSQLQSAMFL